MRKKNMFILMFLFLMSIIIESTFSFYAPRIVDETKLTYSYTCTGVGCLNQDNTQIPNNNFSLTSIRTIIKNTTQTYTITFIYNGTPTGEFSDRLNVANTKNTLIASTRQYD